MKIRVLSYNIHKGFNTLGNLFVLKKIRDSLRETQTDILFLQEVVGENTRHQEKIHDWPSQGQFEYLADSVWDHHSYGKNAIFSERHHGNAILSKFPIKSEYNLNISNHKLEQRGLLHCQVLVPEIKTTLHLFNTHIDLFSSGRKKQLKKISARIASEAGGLEPLIFCGDFNDWKVEAQQHLDSQLNLAEAHTSLHGKPAKTFPGFLPLLSLDRIYYRHLTPIRCQSLSGAPWNQLSDHLPLLAEFDLRPNPT